MGEWLETAKLQFACSAHYLDHFDPINLSAEQKAFLDAIPDRMFRETVRDFLTNQQFRRDYWVRGARAMPLLERTEAIRAQRVVLAVPRGGVDFKLKAGIGEVTLQEEIYGPILNLLADHRPRSILEIEQGTRQTFGQLFQAIMVLVGMGALYPVQDDAAVDASAERALALNRKLCSSSRAQVTTAVLVSPLTGGGLTVNRFEQLFLLARDTGLADPADWAQYVLSLLQQQGQFVVKEGKTLQSNEEQLQELTTQAVNFKETRLPIMRALRICA
jgi:hypothetical protein